MTELSDGIEVNVCRTAAPYQFKNLVCNAETVFTNHFNVKLYVTQNCMMCNYCSIGYYKYIKAPQNFKCRKCKYEWSICGSDESRSNMDKLEKALYNFDDSVSKLKKELDDE